jgi:hypothetical protein
MQLSCGANEKSEAIYAYSQSELLHCLIGQILANSQKRTHVTIDWH